MNIEDLSAEVDEDLFEFSLHWRSFRERQHDGSFCNRDKAQSCLIESNFDQGNAQKVFNLALKYESAGLKNFAFREKSKMFPDKKRPDDSITKKFRNVKKFTKTLKMLNKMKTE